MTHISQPAVPLSSLPLGAEFQFISGAGMGLSHNENISFTKLEVTKDGTVIRQVGELTPYQQIISMDVLVIQVDHN